MASDISEIMGEDIDTEGAQTGNDFEALPAGWYTVLIESAEIAPGRKFPDVPLLTIIGVVVGEKYANRKLFDRVNLVRKENKPPSWKDNCVDMTKTRLASIWGAAGATHSKDTSQLIDKMVQMKVEVRQEEGRSKDNKVVGYSAVGDDHAKKAPGKPEPTARSAAPSKTVQETRPTPAGDSTETKTTPRWMQTGK